ncbi:serine/threonine-protein kinase 11-interacting protein-like isoform X1 [Argiope bruennichi]|uniref:serine/threonine-protein kinase 11-interacting protein-like isoform X1 n=1 Tax=Argiope bruennichi TaxID=94029 RepID=UPI002494F898|nr:serine/threonine-protein kinase 11-interacting protein-like isoform X1 [Argiope bruennichi]
MSLESKYVHASRFAQFLRTNGHKVIDGSCKLSLTTCALYFLNTVFVKVMNKEWPGLLNISVSDAENITTDIRYIYDFIKRTPSLKLFHTGETLRGGVDLSQFTNLKVLEIRKMPLHLIIGFDCLSAQLKVLICCRSIYLLKEIFGQSLNSEKESYSWPELKELNLSCNYLTSLDQSLRNVPNVEILHLSQNHIKNVDGIQVLKNLKFVNLNYNELEHIPVFNIASCRSLTKLYLKNNMLEDLEGIDCLFNLEELDVSNNLLSTYHVLNPLDKLKVLKVLNLEGNPLYFHSHHQIFVASYINQYALMNGFQLNGKILLPTQAMLCNVKETCEVHHTNNHQTSINTVVGDAQTVNCAPRVTDFLTRSISELSERSSYEENSVSSLTSQSGAEQLAVGTKDPTKKNCRRKSKTGKKLKKTREVLINEQAYEESDVISQPVTVTETVVPSHIRAKELIEARRLEKGEAWLIPDHPFQKLSITTPQVPANTPLSNTASPRTVSENELISRITNSLGTLTACSLENDKMLSSAHIPMQSESGSIPMPPTDFSNSDDQTSPIPDDKELKEILNMNADSNSPDLNTQLPPENDDIEILNSSCNEEYLDPQLSISKDDLSDSDIYKKNTVSVNYDEEHEDLESEDELEDTIFFVEIKTSSKEGFKKKPISVMVGSNYIKEKDIISGKFLDRLDLNVLQSVERIVTTENDSMKKWYEIHLEFDTVKSSRQKRIYVLKDIESTKDLQKVLQPFADAKTLKEVTLGALECIKCGSQFSKQVAHKKLIMTKKHAFGKEEFPEERDACPNCGNHILVEMDSFPVPSAAVPPSIDDLLIKGSNASPDTISNGSGSSGKLFSSLFSSMKISPILKRKPALRSQTSQVSDSSASTKDWVTNQNNDFKATTSESTLRRNSSDVTIISNPSQSSIAVIPDPELNLNTIVEKNSQSSLSPPISQDSIYYKAHNTSESEEHAEVCETEAQNAVNPNPDDHPRSTNGTNDFFSVNGDSVNESASHFVTKDALSSGSEQYISPSKSITSHKSKSNSPNETKELDEVSQMLNILGERITITHDAFTEIDHRLKLHLEMNIFGDDEQLEACLQTSIVPLSSGDEFTGLFALSTKKLYIIKFLPLFHLSLSKSEPIEKVIQVVHSSSHSHLKQIKAILGNQGLTFVCGSNSQVFTLVIRDADICNSFSSLLSDYIQEHQNTFGEVKFLSSADETMQLLKDSVFLSNAECEEMPEILLHQFGFWWNSRAGEKNSSIPVCVLITPEHIYVSRVLYKKQDSASDSRKLSVYHYSLVDHQNMSDLVSLKLKKDLRSVEISFLNETSAQQNCDSVFWTVKMETKSALFSFISALKNPWEEIFGVPLSLSCEEE